jgi:serine/threonine protein kinase
LTEEDIDEEIQELIRLQTFGGHPNIVALLKHGWLAPMKFYYIDMELCNLNLSDYIHGQGSNSFRTSMDEAVPDSMRETWKIMIDIARGVEFLHSHGSVHRDLKPANGSIFLKAMLIWFSVLLSREASVWKIADFGCTTTSTVNGVASTKSMRGTPCYRAPELISPRPIYSTKADIWSLGCILYELVAGEKAFSGDFGVYEYAITKEAPRLSDSAWPHDFQSHLTESVQELLAVECDRRPVASDALVLFASYQRLLELKTARSLIDHVHSLPSYADWKNLVQTLPERFDIGYRLAEAYQNDGDETTALKVWKQLVDLHHSTQSFRDQFEKIQAKFQPESDAEWIFVSPPEEEATVCPVQRRDSFHEWQCVTVKNVQQELPVFRRTANIFTHIRRLVYDIFSGRPRARSGISIAALLPGLLLTTFASASSSSEQPVKSPPFASPDTSTPSTPSSSSIVNSLADERSRQVPAGPESPRPS